MMNLTKHLTAEAALAEAETEACGRGSGSSSSIRGEKPQGKGIPPNASRVRAMNEIMTLN